MTEKISIHHLATGSKLLKMGMTQKIYGKEICKKDTTGWQVVVLTLNVYKESIRKQEQPIFIYGTSKA